jgi:hypothetical protein
MIVYKNASKVECIKFEWMDCKDKILVPIRITRQAKRLRRQHINIQWVDALKGITEAPYTDRNKQLRILCGYIYLMFEGAR